MEKKSFSIKARIRSFRYAFQGLSYMPQEHNFRIHLCAMSVALILAFMLSFSVIEWCVLLLTIGVVLMAEIFNTAIERLCDHVSPQRHPAIGVVKDVASAGVLVVAMAALVIGILLYVPKLWEMWS